MKHVIAALLVTAASCALCRGAETPSDGTVDYATFSKLSRIDASLKGREMAAADFERGVYRLLVYGLRPVKSAHDEYLRDNYGVVVIPIAGCVVNQGILGLAEGYNGAMEALLNRKFGHDIFAKAADQKIES